MKTLLRFLSILLVCLLTLVAQGGSAADRYFTVRDSIEMSRPDPENTTILFSPNRHYFATVTSRGLINSDKVESTIWVFSTDKVRSFLRYGGAAPQPHAVARIAVVPHTARNASYGPTIFNFVWLPNSHSILFQGEGTSGERRLYQAEVGGSSKIVPLTPPGYDTAAFTYINGVVACVVTPPVKPRSVGQRINADAVDLTGERLYNIFTPTGYDGIDVPPYSYGALWIIRNGKTTVVHDAQGYPLRVSTMGGAYYAPEMVFSPSPDGHTLAVAMSPRDVPELWTHYNLLTTRTLSLAPHIDPHNAEMLKQLAEYAFVDTSTGKVTQPLQVPMAAPLLANYGWVGVYWSANGREAVLRNTFLSLNGVHDTEEEKRKYPCLAAVVDVTTSHYECLRFVDADDYTRLLKGIDFSLVSASFAPAGNAVTLVRHSSTYDSPLVDEQYMYAHGTWEQRGGNSPHVVPKVAGAQNLSVSFQEELNIPPTLWATDLQRQVTRKLWDPNPQLARMNLGRASVFRWSDNSGHQWTAGLVLPPNYVKGKRYPLVIQTHGFNPNEFLADGFATTANAARPLASAGIVVLQTSYATDHELEPQEMDENLREYHSAIDKLSAMEIVDPARVGIIGFSWTCYHVISALVRDPHLFAAASIDDGVDMSYWWYLGASDETGITSEPEKLYGAKPFGAGLANWVKDSATFHMDRVQAPLLVTAAEGPSTLISEWGVYAALRMQHKPVDLMYIPNGQHELQKPLERLASQQGNVDWFRFWLQGYEDPDPAKVAQYRRWEGLRKL